MNKFWSILIALFCLSSCSGDRCIEADDFGFANFVVSARYANVEMSNQHGENQVAPWRNSNYRVDGRPLVILVRGWTQGSDRNTASELSAWCAWYGVNGNAYKLARFCERLRECTFIDGVMCTDTKDAKISNAPCIFKNGVGLYALIAARETNPNASIATQKNPQGLTFHLGEPTVGYEMLDVDKNGNTRTAGGLVYKYENNDSLKREYEDGELHFKILDKFYDDNSGQYRVTIKSGITNTNPDPITFVTNLIKNFLFGADGDYGLIRNIYKGIVQNPGYRAAVSALLSFYIMWTALSYLAGNVQITHTELIVRVIKIAIVSTLLSSEYSWTFFNNYLFVWFVGGVEQILQMIMEAGATGPGGTSILGMMIAPQTLSKLFSLLFVDWMGFIYIILFFYALYFVIIIFFDAAVIYLTALIAIGMIITIGPIFICFLLFGITRSLFENWLRQLISYAVQPIILFTGLVFISMILRQEIYGALGFRICKQTFPKMSNGGGEVISDVTKELLGFETGDSIFYWWFPQPMKGEQFTRVTRSIPIPVDHFVSGDNVITGADSDAAEFCEAYGCVGQRYVDLPFLDPVRDQRRISQFWNGKFVQLDGMLLIFVAIYLLDKFNGTAVSIARFISGSSANLTNIQNVANSASDGIKSKIDEYGDKVKDKFNETKVGRKITQVKEMASGVVQNIKEAPSRWIDQRRIKSLKQDVLSGKANAAVIAEVKKSTGLDYRDLKKGAIGDYKKALKSHLKEIDPTLTDKQASKIATRMSYKNFSELNNEFAKAKYGKEFSKLSENEKESIKSITNSKYQDKSAEEIAKQKYGKKYAKLKPEERVSVDNLAKLDSNKKSLQELATDAQYSRKYVESYVDAYQALSDRGVGLIGKKSSVIRSLEEINHRAKTRQELTKAKEQQVGEELYAGYQNLKHEGFQSLAGKSQNETIRALGNTYAGGAWNNIDTSPEARNYRMQTYNEQLSDRAKETAYQGTRMQIENLSRSAKESVISPEFIARATVGDDPKLETYRDLARKQVAHKVYEALSSGEEPVLRGEKFMREYAKDSEMVGMIDKAEAIKTRLINDDPFVAKEGRHEVSLQKAEENIVQQRDKLEAHYKVEIPAEKLPEMLEKYNLEKNVDATARRLEREELAKSLKDFEDSQRVLQEIDRRKQDIASEVDKHVSGINEHRKKAGMDEYIPLKTTQVGMRSARTIDDLRRK